MTGVLDSVMTNDRLRDALELLAWSEALDTVRVSFEDFLECYGEEENEGAQHLEAA